MGLWLRQVNLNALLHFEAIARHRSLKGAASELNLSPPALTHSLRRLETALDTRLCERRRGDFRLTHAGEKLRDRCEEIVRGLESFHSDLTDPARFDGVVNVGILDNYRDDRIASLLGSALERFPGTRLALQTHSSEALTEGVVSGELDMGLGLFGPRDPALSYFETDRETFRYYVGNKHTLARPGPVSNRDLTGQSMLWVDHRSRSRTNLKRHVFRDNQDQSMTVAAFTNNLSAAIFLLRTGRHIAALPPSFARPYAEAGEIYQLETTRTVALPVVSEEVVFHARREPPPPLRHFLDQLRVMTSTAAHPALIPRDS